MKNARLFFFCVLALCTILTLSSCDRAKTYWESIQAEMAYNAGDFNKTTTLYKRIIRRDPRNINAHWHLGIVYVSKEDRVGATRQIALLRKLRQNDLADDLQRLLDEMLMRTGSGQ